MGKEIDKIVKEYSQDIDLPLINEILGDKGMNDFELTPQVLRNIGEWALNGSSNEEIRTKLELTPTQWKLLVAICPVLVYVMKSSRALADTIVAGSLFQTAIGGKRVRKQVPVRVHEYDDKGRICGEHYDTMEVWEELPPNPQLLKFLAEKKLSEKFGEQSVDSTSRYAEIINNMTPEERAILESQVRGADLDVKN